MVVVVAFGSGCGGMIMSTLSCGTTAGRNSD